MWKCTIRRVISWGWGIVESMVLVIRNEKTWIENNFSIDFWVWRFLFDIILIFHYRSLGPPCLFTWRCLKKRKKKLLLTFPLWWLFFCLTWTRPPRSWLAASFSTPALLQPCTLIWSHKHEDTVSVGRTALTLCDSYHFTYESSRHFSRASRTCMAPSIAMSALTAALKTEDLPPRTALVSRGDMQTSLSPAEDTGKPKVAILPFSVEALMADRKPSREVVSPDGTTSVPGTSQALGKSARMGSFGSLDTSVPGLAMNSSFSVGDIMSMPEDVLIKPESPDSKDRTSWMQSPRFSPTPPRELMITWNISVIIDKLFVE